MPTPSQEPQTDPSERPIWARYGHYRAYARDSVDSAQDKALTNFFYVVTMIDRYLGPDAASLVTKEHTWQGTKPSPDGEIPVFVYYNVDRVRLLQAVKQFIQTKIRYPLSKFALNVSTRIRNAREIENLKALNEELSKPLHILEDRYAFSAIGQHLLTVPDHTDERLVHVWEFTELGYVRAAVQTFAAAGLPFNGPLNTQQQPSQVPGNIPEANLAKIWQALQVFFAAATKNRITLPAMPEAEGFSRANDIFAYELSSSTSPTLVDYFQQASTLTGVPASFIEAAQYISEHLSTAYSLKLYLIAIVHEQGSAEWSYFTDIKSAQTYMAYRKVLSNPIVRSRISTVFGESEAFKSYSQTDDVADFVFNFIIRPEQYHVNILTAYTNEDTRGRSVESIRSLVGILLMRQGDSVSMAEFDGKAVLIELFETREHMDAHGKQLTEALTVHEKWADLMDLAYSIFGESRLLKVGQSRLIELGSDPEKRILKFTSLLNTLFT